MSVNDFRHVKIVSFHAINRSALLLADPPGNTESFREI